MKFINFLVISLFFFIIVSDVVSKGLKTRFHAYKKNMITEGGDTAVPRDGCVLLFSKCSFQGEQIEVCENVYDFKLIKTDKWSGGFPTCIKLGKYVTASMFLSANYKGKSYTTTQNIDCYKNTGFTNDPGSLKVNHIREYTPDKTQLDQLNKEWEKEDQEEMSQIEIDRRAIRHASRGDLLYDGDNGFNSRNFNKLNDKRAFIEKSKIPHIEDLPHNTLRSFPRPSNRDDEEFHNLMTNRIFAVEQKLEKILNERAHPSIACFESKIITPGEVLLNKTKVIWNRVQFNKDPGTFKLGADRTTIEVLKPGLYKFDVNIVSNIGSNIQAILDFNNTDEIRFHASATTGNTQDASLVYYKELVPLDHFAVFIASTGSGPNNIITEPVNRLCIRKI